MNFQSPMDGEGGYHILRHYTKLHVALYKATSPGCWESRRFESCLLGRFFFLSSFSHLDLWICHCVVYVVYLATWA